MSQADELTYFMAHVGGVIDDAKVRIRTTQEAVDIIMKLIVDTPELIPLIEKGRPLNEG